jgi:lysophospholipase L1-like esterase
MQLGALAAIALICSLGVSRAEEVAGVEPFAPEIHLFDVEDEVYPPTACGSLFIGSSSIRFWFRLDDAFPSKNIIRRGFGGAAIGDVNYYFDRLVSRYRPREIVFYAGENDINAGKSPEDVFAEFKKFMEKKAAVLGDTPVYFVSIKPSVARIGDFDAQSRANRIISNYAKRRTDLVFVDVASRMMENGQPKAIFVSDRLHMSAAGYEIWRAALVEAFMGDKMRGQGTCY